MNTTDSIRQRGFTLVEACVTLAIAAIVVGAAAPSFKRAIERRHVEGAAAQLETDVQFARSLAVSRNQGIRISFQATANSSCYVLHHGAAGDCQCSSGGAAVCKAGIESFRTVYLGKGAPVHLQSNSSSMLFDPLQGTVTPTATVKVQGDSGAAIHQVVNIMGRVRSCSPAPTIAGYKPC